VMIYRRIESHLLERGQPERLEIVRRCLYYKAGKKLSQPPRAGKPSWQRLLMERMTAEWGWDQAKLALLDSRSQWRIQEVEAERNELVKELTLSYRFLSEFARRSDAVRSIDAREFSILGRKLYAAYERKAGKIDTVNPGRAINVAENEIGICAVRSADGSTARWAVWPGAAGARRDAAARPLKQAGSVSELLAWCAVNGVIGEQTRISTRERADGLRATEVRSMVRELREHVLSEAGASGDEPFGEGARVTTLLVFVNVATDPLAQARAAGVQRVSSRTDSLGFSALRENLVLNLETVTRNSWGEVVAARHAGVEGLMRCLRDYLQISPGEQGARPRVVVRCLCPSRAGPIAARVAELYSDVEKYFHQERAGANARYVLEVRNRLHLLAHRRGASSMAAAGSPAELYELLGAAQPDWSSLAVDRHALERSPLAAIAPRIEPWRCVVFSEARAEGIALTIVDEHGSFSHREYAGARESSLLAATDQFLQSVRYRQSTSAGTDADRPTAGPRYFRLGRSAGGSYAAHELPPPSGLRPGAFLNVQALAEPREGEVLFTVYCDDVAFSQAELGADFAFRLARYVRGRRRATEIYPVYLTDLDLSALGGEGDAPLQTIDYLRHRQQLEALVNRALEASTG